MSQDEAGEDYDILKLQPDESFLEDEDEAMEEGETATQTRNRGGEQVKPPAPLGVKSYENTQTWLGAGVLPSLKKLEERAARFGIASDATKRLTEETLKKLYDSCKIPQFERELLKQVEEGAETTDSGTPKRTPYWRLNALNLRGTDDMSTQEVFRYFTAYGPLSIEWVNDTSCNVVWEDRLAAARALAYMSQGVISEKPKATAKPEVEKDAEDNRDDVVIAEEEEEEEEEGEVVEMDCEEGELPEEPSEKEVITLPDEKVLNPEDVAVAVPAGYVWRLGKPSEKAKAIIMRFATVEDRKAARAEKQSHYYRKYGNPNFRGMTGLISESRKRRFLEEKGRRSGRGGAHALDRSTDAQAPVSKKNPWGALAAAWSEEWRAQDAPHTPPAPPPSTHSPKSSVRDGESDLNLSFSESSSDSDDSDNVVEWESRNKRPRMRMYADDVETAAKSKKKLRSSRERDERHRWTVVGPVAAEVEERVRPRFGGAIPRSRTMDSTEPRPRSRRNNRGNESFITDLRRRLSRSTKDDEDGLEDDMSNGIRVEKALLKITITNPEANGRRRGSDSDDDEDYDSSPRRMPRRRRSDDRGLRARLRRPAVSRGDDDDDDSDEVLVRAGVPDLREKLRQKRAGGETKKMSGALSPLRIEVDNDVYYGIIGSESDE